MEPLNVPVGTRVFGIASIDEGVAVVLGPGTATVPKVPEVCGLPQHDALGLSGTATRCVTLDSGETAFEFEAWWVPMDQVEGVLQGRGVETITVKDLRKAALEGRIGLL